eukprot:4406928-Alexandrium_andersonii.AAC.1
MCIRDRLTKVRRWQRNCRGLHLWCQHVPEVRPQLHDARSQHPYTQHDHYEHRSRHPEAEVAHIGNGILGVVQILAVGLPEAGQEEHGADHPAQVIDAVDSLVLLGFQPGLVLAKVAAAGVQPEDVEVGVPGSPGTDLRQDVCVVLLVADVAVGGGLHLDRLLDEHVLLPEVQDLPRPQLLAIPPHRGGVTLEDRV